MTVFIAHAPADAETAEALENFLERRGQFVERDDGQVALRPVTPHDTMVLLVSNNLLFAQMRLRLEQRALDAWAEGRLILVKLDHSIAPVGLRDLPSIDASFVQQREFKWQDVANAIREKARTGPAGQGAPAEGRAPPRKKSGGGDMGGAVLQILLALPGLAAIAAGVAIWLAGRIGPSPGGWRGVLAGVDAFGVRYGAPEGVAVWAFAAAIALTLLVLAAFIARALFRGGKEPAPAPIEIEADAAPAPAALQSDDQVFVSYARANQAVVLPVVEGAKQAGRKFWLDQQGLTVGGEGWAGEIVRAIRGAAGVVVMCSKAAFESDHVKREVYLADRYRRRLIPVFIEDAEPPEDFEYFFAGIQHVKLYETPEGERPQALAAVLGEAA